MHNPHPPVKVSERAGDPIFTPYLVSKFRTFPVKHCKKQKSCSKKRQIERKQRTGNIFPIIIYYNRRNRVCFSGFRGVFISCRLMVHNYTLKKQTGIKQGVFIPVYDTKRSVFRAFCIEQLLFCIIMRIMGVEYKKEGEICGI